MSEVEQVVVNVEYEFAVEKKWIDWLKAEGKTDYEASEWVYENMRDPEKVSVLGANVQTSDDFLEVFGTTEEDA